MQHIINDVVQSLGYTGVFVLMCFFAAELIMPFAGYVVWSGNLTLLGVIIAGTLGSTLGSIVLYYAAQYIKQESAYGFIKKYGRWIGISVKNFSRSEQWFDRHAKTTVFVGKLLPAIRTATSVSAGYRHMRFVPYVLCTLAATALWSGFLAVTGFLVTDRYASVQNAGQYLSAGIILMLIVYVIYRVIRHRKPT